MLGAHSVKSVFRRFGISISRSYDFYQGLEPEFKELYEAFQPYTMTSLERMYALYQATCYVHNAQIPGSIVECGVWRGGSAMLAAKTFLNLSSSDRQFFLYDTFSGMTAPTDSDIDLNGNSAGQMGSDFLESSHADGQATRKKVRQNLVSIGYPEQNLTLIEGKVEDTLTEPENLPEKIALLRLDTDWYESTRFELEVLYPRLQPGGVLIIDDYGYWKGARKAVDEYFQKLPPRPLLQRIDHTGRMAIKPQEFPVSHC